MNDDLRYPVGPFTPVATTADVIVAATTEIERLPKVSGAVDTSMIYVTQAVNEALTRAE